MVELQFRVTGVDIQPFSATPLLSFQVHISHAHPNISIHAISLRSQIYIAATRRIHTPEQQGRLTEVFGEPERWSDTLRNLLWIHASINVPAFKQSTMVDLNIPCSYDFNIAATKYFYALDEGEIPLLFIFSGTVFYTELDGSVQIGPITWNKEAFFEMPTAVWLELMERYYPNQTWLHIRKPVFERLYQYRLQHGFTSWEQVLEHLLSQQNKNIS
jgi:hypothetical protein